MKKIFVFLIMVLFFSNLKSQVLVDENTQIKVCFSAVHTFVSDLGFYLVAPGVNPVNSNQHGVVELLPSVSAWYYGVTSLPSTIFGCLTPSQTGTNCNSGNNVTDFCFTTSYPVGDPVFTACMCDLPVPITGDFASCGTWERVYGYPASNASWKVIITDCIGQDVGYITGISLEFICNNTTYSYNINDNIPIIDDACNFIDATIVGLEDYCRVTGKVFNDYNSNCIIDLSEPGINNRLIRINPGNIITQTNYSGSWSIVDLPPGSYTATVDTSGNYSTTCSNTQIFTITSANEIISLPSFGLVSNNPCTSPDISLNMPFMRPCFNNQKIYVTACNKFTANMPIYTAYADVELDSFITLQNANLSYINLGNNIYRFQLGNLNPGQCKHFILDCSVSCNVILGQTLCMEAKLFPVEACVFDTIPNNEITIACNLPWDNSSLQAEGYCLDDSIYFVVTNTGDFGNGDMDCFSHVRIYIDGFLTSLDSIKLIGGDSIVFAFNGDGRTWRLEADQHPLHPGNSHPNATVEACGNLNNWTPNLVNVLPQDDADPVIDIYCGVVTGSYDPNDKTGFPLGLTSQHYIMPNQQLQYVIRFQNTGTDTAFSVIVRDTLDIDLNIFSVSAGASSHSYNFRMYGPRVLEWTFLNILLPDSNTNEVNSHGFCTFIVNQNQNLSNFTKIYNSASIYFDYNVPIVTNQTVHTINDKVQSSLVSKVIINGNKTFGLIIYPNPANKEVYIEVPSSQLSASNFKIFSIDGKVVKKGKLEGKKTRINTNDLENGIYFIEVSIENEKVNSKLIITR